MIKDIIEYEGKKVEIRKKILAFITFNGKFLALRNKSSPEHGGHFWFVVTGYVEKQESDEEAVMREILEETGLKTAKIIDLRWGSVYNWKNEVCEEHNFLAFVDEQKIIRNEEHDAFGWLSLDDFVKTIRWDDDKIILIKVLEKAIKYEHHFTKRKIIDYRGRS